ncbi:MAG: glycosyltransferase [Candidatus Aenigmarchaeota archaeon]|nr:glycosyltransferase [Candidatus Aenigmarchaeota archaeon]
MKPNLSVVIPAYNEEMNIKKVIELTINSLKGLNFELVIVDDGSKDKTKDIVKKLMKKYKRLRLIVKDVNKGYADALRTGFNSCKGEYITFIDADLQNRPEDIPKLIDWVDKGYDIVIGWRKDRKDILIRLIVSRLWNSLCHLLFQIPFPDINGKPKVFKAGILKDIKIETKQWVIDLELVHKALKKGYKGMQVPVGHSSREDKQSKATFRKGLISLMSLLEYRVKSW